MKEKIEDLSEENEDLNNEITDLGDVNEENISLKNSIEILENSNKEYIKSIESSSSD